MCLERLWGVHVVSTGHELDIVTHPDSKNVEYIWFDIKKECKGYMLRACTEHAWEMHDVCNV